MNKAQELQKIALDIEHCKICQQDKLGKAVPGEGNPDADIVFIGEAPGKTESATGRPFIGRSGQLLRLLIKEHGKMIEKDGRKYFITYHPSAAIRFPPLKKLLMENFEKLSEIYTHLYSNSIALD